MSNYTVAIDDAYVTPDGALTKEQYITLVMNKAAESYKKNYGTANFDLGIQAACDAYNAALAEELSE